MKTFAIRSFFCEKWLLAHVFRAPIDMKIHEARIFMSICPLAHENKGAEICTNKILERAAWMISEADDRQIFERFPSIATGILSDHGLMEAKSPAISGAGNLKNQRVCAEIARLSLLKNLFVQICTCPHTGTRIFSHNLPLTF
ncbi:MAG: hypothetical protein SOZ59_16065 [Candidatus Limivivens sp.]|nr:hypothetical protein [Candidatus Limivivens sp.]